TELLLHRAKEIWWSVNVGRGRRSWLRCSTKRTHAGIRRELQDESVTGIAEIRLIDHGQIHELRLHDAGKLCDGSVPDIEPALWQAAKAWQRKLDVLFFFDLLAALCNGDSVSLQFAFIVVELQTEAIDDKLLHHRPHLRQAGHSGRIRL